MIQISDEYYLDADRYCYVLKYQHQKKSKKSNVNTSTSTFTDIGYYGTIQSLYGAIIEHKIKLYPTVLTNVTELLTIKKDVMEMVSNCPSINELRREFSRDRKHGQER